MQSHSRPWKPWKSSLFSSDHAWLWERFFPLNSAYAFIFSESISLSSTFGGYRPSQYSAHPVDDISTSQYSLNQKNALPPYAGLNQPFGSAYSTRPVEETMARTQDYGQVYGHFPASQPFAPSSTRPAEEISVPPPFVASMALQQVQ